MTDPRQIAHLARVHARLVIAQELVGGTDMQDIVLTLDERAVRDSAWRHLQTLQLRLYNRLAAELDVLEHAALVDADG